MGNKQHDSQILEVEPGSGFYNIRSGFKLFKGLVNIGTQMSLVRLENGNFIALSTVPLDDQLKKEIDDLTEDGQLLIAVIATHPFHTLAFHGFYEAYPKALYIGTPRHVRNIKTIPWHNLDVTSEEIQKYWEPEISMRIPAGSEFTAPVPEMSNHFNSVWVYHKASKTIHIDDTVMYFSHPGQILKLVGKKHNQMEFHMSMSGPGLYPAPDAPAIFKQWVKDIIEDWDFDNLCCAHTGRKIGGAKQALRETLENAEHIFKKLEKAHKDNVPLSEMDNGEDDPKDCEKYNVDGTECG